MDASLVQLLASGPNWAEKTTAIATIVLAAAAWAALRSLKDARKTRHAQLVTDLSNRWDAPYIHRAVALAREYGSDGTLKLVEAIWSPDVTKRNADDLRDWYRISVYPNLIETLGVYVAEELISAELVYKLWGGSIVSAWQNWANTIFRLRVLTDEPEVWIYFQYLGTRMRDLIEEERVRGGPLRPPAV